MALDSCTEAPEDMARETEIRGKVTRDGAPLEGAYLRLGGTDGEFVGEIRSDEAGKFRFYVAAGDWTLVCLAPGAERIEHPLSLKKGDEVDLEFEVSQGKVSVA